MKIAGLRRPLREQSACWTSKRMWVQVPRTCVNIGYFCNYNPSTRGRKLKDSRGSPVHQSRQSIKFATTKRLPLLMRDPVLKIRWIVGKWDSIESNDPCGTNLVLPRIYIKVEGKNQISKVILWPPCTQWLSVSSLNTLIINKLKIKRKATTKTSDAGFWPPHTHIWAHTIANNHIYACIYCTYYILHACIHEYIHTKSLFRINNE